MLLPSLEPFFGLSPPREFESRLVPSFSQKRTREPVRFCDGQGEPDFRKSEPRSQGARLRCLGGRRVSVKGFGDWGKDGSRKLAERGQAVYQRAGWRAPQGGKWLSDSPDGPESVALNNRVVNSPPALSGP